MSTALHRSGTCAFSAIANKLKPDAKRLDIAPDLRIRRRNRKVRRPWLVFVLRVLIIGAVTYGSVALGIHNTDYSTKRQGAPDP